MTEKHSFPAEAAAHGQEFIPDESGESAGFCTCKNTSAPVSPRMIAIETGGCAPPVYVKEDTPAPEPHLVGWEHISSAPRDGSEVLVWNGRSRHVAHYDRVESEWVSPYRTTTKRLPVAPKPTHWQPLPAEPTALAAEGPQQ